MFNLWKLKFVFSKLQYKANSLNVQQIFLFVHALYTDTVIRTEATIVNKIMDSALTLTELTVEWRNRHCQSKKVYQGNLKLS